MEFKVALFDGLMGTGQKISNALDHLGLSELTLVLPDEPKAGDPQRTAKLYIDENDSARLEVAAPVDDRQGP